MRMKIDLINLRNLYSNDDKIVLTAINEKKDWINQNFYLILSLVNSQDIADLFDGKLRFKKLYIDPSLCKNDEFEKINKEFEKFRVLYLYDTIPDIIDENEFVLKINFQKLSHREYMMLFANFYHCLSKKEILIEEDNNLINLLKKAMVKDLGDNVIIMDEENLVNSCFSCRVEEEIIYNDNLNKGYLSYLSLTCEKLHISMRKI